MLVKRIAVSNYRNSFFTGLKKQKGKLKKKAVTMKKNQVNKQAKIFCS